jgi:hypothetical protein
MRCVAVDSIGRAARAGGIAGRNGGDPGSAVMVNFIEASEWLFAVNATRMHDAVSTGFLEMAQAVRSSD